MAVDSIVGTFRDVSRVLVHYVELVGERIDRHLYMVQGREKRGLDILPCPVFKCSSRVFVGCAKRCDTTREKCPEHWVFNSGGSAVR